MSTISITPFTFATTYISYSYGNYYVELEKDSRQRMNFLKHFEGSFLKTMGNYGYIMFT